MTGWAGVVFAGLFLGLAGVFWRVSDRGRGVSQGVVVAGMLVAPLLVWTCLADAALNSRFGDMHLSLTRLSLDVTRGGLSIGGGPEDDLFIRGAAPGVVVIPRQTLVDQTGAIRLEVPRVAASATHDTTSVAAVRHGDTYDYIGAQDFRPGMAVCVRACSGTAARWYGLDAKSPRFQRLGRGDGQGRDQGPILPQRRAFGIVPTLSWKASQALVPLSRALPGEPASRSIVYQSGKLFGDGWKILLLDPDAMIGQVGSDGRVVASPRPSASPWTVADTRALSIWDVRVYDEADPGQPLGRLQERRAVTLVQDGPRLTATLATPAVERVGQCPRNGSPSPIAPDFPVLGGGLAHALTQDLPYPEAARCADLVSGTFDITDPAAPGKSASLRLQRLGAPWLMGWLSLAWACVVLIVWRRDWIGAATGRARLHMMLVAGLQTLLGLRMMIAFAGVVADPELDQGLAATGQAALAYVALPAALLLLAPPLSEARRRRRDLLLIAAFVAASGLAIHLWMAGVPGPWFATWTRPEFWRLVPGGLATVAAAAVLVWTVALAFGPTLGGRFAGMAARQGGQVGRWLTAMSARFQQWRSVLPITALGRLALGLVSIKERLPVLGFAVSALYTPALIIGLSGLMAEATRVEGWQRFRLGAVFCVALAVLFVLLPVGVKDNGYALVGIPVMVMVGWGVWQRRGQIADRAGWLSGAAWAAPLAGAILAVMAASVVLQAPPAASPDDIDRAAVAASDQPALDILARAGAYSQNQLRLWAFGSPGQVERYGSWEAENLRVWSQHLSDYTATLLGRGYLAPVNLSVLKPVQLNDNVSTIHVIAPFGRVGAAGLLLCLGVLAAAAARATRPEADAQPSQARLIGLMALWVLFGVGAYVVLANLQMVPFTGRNVYLLAAASDSDLLEGATLIAMAWLGLSRSSTVTEEAAWRDHAPS
ncbi:hypothetical protein BH10PSE2_BH10PSE2_24500 [soil metagenome]